MEPKEKWVAPVQKVQQDRAVQQVQLVPWVQLDQEVKEAVKDHLAHQVFVVLTELQGLLVHQVVLVNQDHQGSLGQLVLRVTKGFRDQKDLRVSRGREVNLVSLVLLVKEDLWVYLVKTEWLEKKALLVLRVILVHQVSLVLVVPLVYLVVLVYQEQKETEDSQVKEASRETPA